MQMGTDARSLALLEGLNEPQREAVLHTDGPLVILAGPGSGKTRVVTRRAAHLARTVTYPRHILAITFTNKAAREMRERIEALAVEPGMTVCTFHALCAMLLRMQSNAAGVPANFSIFDRDDRRKLLKRAIEECDLSTTNWSPARVEAVISSAKNDMLTAEAFASDGLDWQDRTIARIYVQYEQLMAEMGALDFDDLLMRMALLLADNSALRDALQDRFQYVLIDEYQDTNEAQYRIARYLTQKRRNLCATGDPDQSIYGWRGANIENILTFERDFPEARVIRLEQNYRSTQRILDAADRIIAGNVQRKQKTLWTENDDGERIRVVECETAEEEAQAVARDIRRQLDEGVPPNEIAVVYRVNALSRAVEEALISEGIAYQVARGVAFYNRREIKDVIAYLRVLVNPADEVSLLRIINMPPRGIGATTLGRLTGLARQQGRSLFDVVTGKVGAKVPGRAAARVSALADLFRDLTKVLDRPANQALAYVISHTGLRAHYRGEGELDEGPAENLDELINAASVFMAERPEGTIIDWLEHTALVSDVDAVDSEGGPVTLMTLHAAKGLEFTTVFMIGMEDGLLPLRRQDDDDVDAEEERRLCFVGMTRAKRHLILSRARYRMHRGSTHRTACSPFLDELPRDAVDWREPDSPGRRNRRGRSFQDGHLPEDIEAWTIGALVRHPLHGLGQIVSIEPSARRTHVGVQFQDGSQRNWVLEFAPLERVDFDDVG